MTHGDYHEVSQKFIEWGVGALLDSIDNYGMILPKKVEVYKILRDSLPLEPAVITNNKQDEAKKAIFSVLKAKQSHLHLKISILKLLTIFGINNVMDDVAFVKTPHGIAELFLKSFGVAYLCKALMPSKHQKGLEEGCLV